MSDSVRIEVKGAVLARERWGSDGPVVVLVRANVADRRSWYGVAERLSARRVSSPTTGGALVGRRRRAGPSPTSRT